MKKTNNKELYQIKNKKFLKNSKKQTFVFLKKYFVNEIYEWEEHLFCYQSVFSTEKKEITHKQSSTQ